MKLQQGYCKREGRSTQKMRNYERCEAAKSKDGDRSTRKSRKRGKKILNKLFWGNVSKNIKIFTSYDYICLHICIFKTVSIEIIF